MGFNYVKTDNLPSKTKVTFNKSCNNKETLLVIHDSYTKELERFISMHYQKVVYLRYNLGRKNRTTLDMALINKINPDVVMVLVVERYLKVLSKFKIINQGRE